MIQQKGKKMIFFQDNWPLYLKIDICRKDRTSFGKTLVTKSKPSPSRSSETGPLIAKIPENV